jgi:hypothetical protein
MPFSLYLSATFNWTEVLRHTGHLVVRAGTSIVWLSAASSSSSLLKKSSSGLLVRLNWVFKECELEEMNSMGVILLLRSCCSKSMILASAHSYRRRTDRLAVEWPEYFVLKRTLSPHLVADGDSVAEKNLDKSLGTVPFCCSCSGQVIRDSSFLLIRDKSLGTSHKIFRDGSFFCILGTVPFAKFGIFTPSPLP